MSPATGPPCLAPYPDQELQLLLTFGEVRAPQEIIGDVYCKINNP